MENILEVLLQQADGGTNGLVWRMSGGGNSQIIDALKSDDEIRQLEGVSSLCTELNMATPLTLTMINTHAIVPPLLGCLRKAHNPELQLMAARALTYMADSLPRTLDILSSDGNVNALLEPVTAVQDIDLAEQCISCVEKLTQTGPGSAAAFRANGIDTMLAFVDFFTISTQRYIWIAISRMCKNVDTKNFDSVRDALPAMRASFASGEVKIRERAMSALLRIVCGVRKDQRMVDAVFDEMPPTLVGLITRPDTEEATFNGALSLILAAVSFSDVAIRKVIEGGLLTALLHLLDGSTTTVVMAAGGDEEEAESDVGTLIGDAADAQSPLSTNPRASSPNGIAAATPAKRRTLSFENSKVLCSIFMTMLVPNRDGPFAYIEQLMRLEPQEVATRLAAPVDAVAARTNEEERSGESNDDEEDEDNFEDVSDSADEERDGPNEKQHVSRDDRVTVETLRERLRASDSIQISQQASNARLLDVAHICDGCNKLCDISDWYRCNQCRDADFCTSCLLSSHKDHYDGKHTFTDMKAIVEAAVARPKGHSALELAELTMYREKPELLAEVLRAVPKVVVLCTQAEAAVIRVSGMSFLLSAATMAPVELLVAAGMNGANVCEALVAALTDPSMLLNIMGVALMAKLLDKLPAPFATVLVREGVARTLSQLHAKYPAPLLLDGSGASEAAQLQKRTLTSQGWHEVIGMEVASVFERFPSLADTPTSESLLKLVMLLDANDLSSASIALREALTNHSTAYEFMEQSLFRKLKEAFLRCGDDIDPVLTFVVSLCQRLPGDIFPSSAAASAASTSASHLGELIHMLHTVLARLDNFMAPTFGPIRSIHARLPLQLVPHTPTPARNLSSYPTPPELTAAQRLGAQSKRGGKKSGGDHSTEGNVTNANIEPLASVRTICDFIARNLVKPVGGLRGVRRGADRGDSGEGNVEDVLPELGEIAADDGGIGAKAVAKRTKKEDETPQVWVRYENDVLPLSMTTVQIFQRYVNPRTWRDGKRGSSNEQGDGAGSSIAIKPIRLYYSTKPFEASYKMASVATAMPTALASELNVVLPTQDPRPTAVRRALEQLRQTFMHSKPYLTEAQMDVLTLLGVLHAVVDNWAEVLQYLNRKASLSGGNDTAAAGQQDEAAWSPPVSRADFVHHKLNNKAMRHCSNLLLAGQHTGVWAVNLALDCNFLFTASTRNFLFEVSFCGTVRSLARMQQRLVKYGVRDSSSEDQNPGRSVVLGREKKRVWRQHPLECAMALLGGERVSGANSWEFEFYGETGSGLGPTREFYTLVAQALRERARQLWRQTTETAQDTLYSPLNGLYPRPLAANAPPTTVVDTARHFKFIGRFLGRALLDEQVASLPLSPVLLKLLRGDACSVHDVRGISESVYDVLLAMMEATSKSTNELRLPGQNKTYPVEGMSLLFTLPGDDEVELKEGGASEEVTAATMAEYCDAVTKHLLDTGVRAAVVALREGFNDYIPLTALRMLSVEEIFEVVNGHTTPVTREEFEEHCSADHGFTVSCKHVKWLFDILASFSVEEQRRFFLFLTGSPHLPVGGLASLRPKLTIVRKTSSDPSVKESEQLPSAMTCQNYLKLPAYDSKEQMREKLVQAIDEGTGAFLLS